jgi:NH3-dependent NAD+ synthetase
MSGAIDRRLELVIKWLGQVIDPAASGRGAMVPVSGGSDSALCFWLCCRALPPGRAIGLHVGRSLRCAEWFEAQGPVHRLEEPAAMHGVEPHRTEAMRWAMTLSHARGHRCWVTGSRNRTEEVLGSYSLASRACTLFPLAGLWKSQVMELCAAVGVPVEITGSSGRADPDCGRPVEMAEIRFADVDLFLQTKVGERTASELAKLDARQVAYLEGVYRRNRFKEELPYRAPVCER